MSTTVVLVIVAVAVAVAVAFFARRRKKTEEPTVAPERKEEAQPAEKAPASAAAPAQEVSKEAAKEPPAKEEPKGEAAPGVRSEDAAEKAAAEELKAERRERKLQRLRQGLAPTRGGFIAKIGALFQEKKELDPGLLGQLEETLLTADVGARTTDRLVGLMRGALDRHELGDSDAAFGLLRGEVKKILSVDAPEINVKSDRPYTIMVVGVNGVGKTTTIGKLATKFTDQGLKVVLAAGDTFRAAAVNQLEIWGRRANAEVVKAKEGSDPSSVVFDAIKQAKETGVDVVIADTAGRLHTKVPLMEEIKKVRRVMTKAHEAAPHQVLLVLDATTGQNALQQVAMFKEAVDVNGLVLTKLDGTAKGGVIIGICHEHGIPVRYVGIGEAKDDLREFEVEDFVEALFLREEAK
ncbi:MAG: signal recognition particle-docking protein FtsY [Deltaproteobacteria bacterium]|nr:signal recognition particle-docking protein FtsY [Deltaproteobacteria bacterium]